MSRKQIRHSCPRLISRLRRSRELQISHGDGPGGRPERRWCVLHNGRVHASAGTTVAAGRPVQRPTGPAAQGQQGPVLHRPGRRAVPVRVGLPAGWQAVAARELPGEGAAPVGGGLLPAGRPYRAAPRTEARLHHGRLPRYVRLRPGRAVRRQLPQDSPDIDMRPRGPVPRRVWRLAQREQGPGPRRHGPVHGQVGVYHSIFNHRRDDNILYAIYIIMHHLYSFFIVITIVAVVIIIIIHARVPYNIVKRYPSTTAEKINFEKLLVVGT